MSEENKNLNEEELESSSEAEAAATEEAETAADVTEADDETVDTEAAAADGETADVEITEADGKTSDVEIAETAEEVPAEEQPVKGSNKKVVVGVVVVIAVLVVAAIISVFAIYGKTWFNPYNKNHIDVTGRTTGEVADMMGMEYDEFIQTYNLPSDMPETTFESAASYLIPAGTYAEMNGVDLAELREFFGWDESITEETPIGEALDKTKLSLYVGEDYLDTFKEQYGFGDEITGDTLWGEVRETVELRQKAEYDAQREAMEEETSDDGDDAATEEVTEAPADAATEATATEAAATAVPAE